MDPGYAASLSTYHVGTQGAAHPRWRPIWAVFPGLTAGPPTLHPVGRKLQYIPQPTAQVLPVNTPTMHRRLREGFETEMRQAAAGPASLIGHYPRGNTGGTNVHPFRSMPIPPDLEALLGDWSVVRDDRGRSAAIRR
jgi:hypothetical protein